MIQILKGIEDARSIRGETPLAADRWTFRFLQNLRRSHRSLFPQRIMLSRKVIGRRLQIAVRVGPC